MSNDLAAIASGLRALERRRWCPHDPHQRQREFLACAELEAFYGGAAGGGKSDALLMAALQFVHVPKYSALILRRTYKDLAKDGAIMDRCASWLRGKACRWDALNKRWTFESGARLTFGYMDHPNDRFQYDSAEFQFVGFDELTQFPEVCYTYMFSRLRKTEDIAVPLRMRAAGMPGGIGHDWVKARFIDGGHRFVPAKASDNPGLDQVSYRESLSHLDAVTRRQREDGVWEQDAAGLLYQVPDTAWISKLPEGTPTLLRCLDFGIVDANAIGVIGWWPNDRAAYVLSAKYFKGGPHALADELRKDPRTFWTHVGDVGGMGKAFQEDIQLRAKIPIERADKTAKLGAIRLFNDEVRRGLVKFYAPDCVDLRKEYQSLLRKEDGTEYTSQANHCADAILYGWRACPSFMEREKQPVPAIGSSAWESEQERRLELEVKRDDSNRGRHGWLKRMSAL